MLNLLSSLRGCRSEIIKEKDWNNFVVTGIHSEYLRSTMCPTNMMYKKKKTGRKEQNGFKNKVVV